MSTEPKTKRPDCRATGRANWVRTRLLISLASFALMAIWGCGRQNSSPPITTNASWTDLLSVNRSNILYGPWEQAESRWAALRSDGRLPANLGQWVQLQVDILTITPPDGLKYELRVSAIQEMYWETEMSKQHLGWLKTNVETGFFREAKVAQKAKELLNELKTEVARP